MLMKMMRMWLLASFVVLSLGLSAQAATPKDVLVVAQIAEPKSMDPATVTAVNDFRILMNLYDGLVRYRSGTLEVEPGLAESWTISDDGKVYTFSLRQELNFTMAAPSTPKRLSSTLIVCWLKITLRRDWAISLIVLLLSNQETTVVDEYTVRFRMDDPYAPLLSNLAHPTGLIISRKPSKNTARMSVEIQLEPGPTNLENGRVISTLFLIRMVATGMGRPH